MYYVCMYICVYICVHVCLHVCEMKLQDSPWKEGIRPSGRQDRERAMVYVRSDSRRETSVGRGRKPLGMEERQS